MKHQKRKKRVKKLLVLAVVLIVARAMYVWITMVDVDQINNLNSNRIQIIGHGGSGQRSLLPFQYLPLNSEASIRDALAKGIDGIELDVQVTADSVLVLYHDHSLKQSTYEKQHYIPNLKWDDFKDAHHRIGFPYDMFQDEPIISFEHALDIFLEADSFPILHLDFHGFNMDEAIDDFEPIDRYIHALKQLLSRKSIPTEKVFFMCTHEYVLEKVRTADLKVNLVLEETSDILAGIQKAQSLGCKHIHGKIEILTRENVAAAHAAGLFVSTHAGKSRWGLAKRIELNVDCIQTDNIDILKDLLD